MSFKTAIQPTLTATITTTINEAFRATNRKAVHDAIIAASHHSNHAAF